MNKQMVAYLYNGTSAIKGKGAVTPAATWLGRENRMLSEGSRSRGVTRNTIQLHEMSKTPWSLSGQKIDWQLVKAGGDVRIGRDS